MVHLFLKKLDHKGFLPSSHLSDSVIVRTSVLYNVIVIKSKVHSQKCDGEEAEGENYNSTGNKITP